MAAEAGGCSETRIPNPGPWGNSYTSVVVGGGSLEKDKENKEESERKWQVQKSMALQNPRPERVVRKEKPTQVGVCEEIREPEENKGCRIRFLGADRCLSKGTEITFID